MLLKNDPTVKQFVSYVKFHTKQHGVDVIITNHGSVNLGDGVGRASAYFNTEIIRIAGKCRPYKDVLKLLIHEYSHFIQFINKEKVWTDADHNINYICDKSVSTIKHQHLVEYDKLLEIDAEKKSVDLIKTWNLPIDIDSYIKEANAYIHFYNYIKKHRRWCIKSPSSIKSITDIMSVTFQNNYDNLPEGYENLVEKYCL